jgi:hypothetical protein
MKEDSATYHFLLLIKVHLICLVYSLLQRVFEAIALFNADQHNEAMLLVKELAAASPDTDLGCRLVEVSVRQLCSVIDTDLCRSHIRHILMFSSEPKPWVTRVSTKPPITSLPPSMLVLPHQNSFMKLIRT